jgi:undecaprenyl-diphosphatase
MTIIQAVVLGFVQGLTEFLPVSSSAHLVLVPFFLGWKIPINEAFIFDVLVQIATLTAVITYFIHDLVRIIRAMWTGIMSKELFWNQDAKIGWFLILSTIPAGITGLLIKPLVKSAFDSPLAVGIFLIITALLLLLAELLGSRQRSFDNLTFKDVIWMGLLQALAIFPGISRSGATISAGMLNGLDRRSSARFSFLMSVPIMLAAGLMSLLDLLKSTVDFQQFAAIGAGCIISAIVGYLSIRWLLRFLINRSFLLFSFYCAIVGGITIILVLF